MYHKQFDVQWMTTEGKKKVEAERWDILGLFELG